MGNPLDQTFLNEPYKKWFVFLIVMTLFLAVWGGVVRLIARR
jgi:hypothetical protein